MRYKDIDGPVAGGADSVRQSGRIEG